MNVAGLKRTVDLTARSLAVMAGWTVVLSSRWAWAGGGNENGGSQPPKDKSQYNLFHPVPASELRDLDTDRPSQADSPITVDAGHIQVETDFFNYVYDVHNPERARVRIDQWNALDPVVRIGIIDQAELQIEYNGYINLRVRDHSSKPTQVEATSGVGDLILGSKINLWGNEGGQTALAIFPELKVPTNSAGLGNRYVEGYVGFPFNWQLPADFKLNVEPEFGFVRNRPDTRYVALFSGGAGVSHELGIKNLASYVEFFYVVSTEHNAFVSGQVDVGVTYQIGKNLQIDGGCNIGVTRAAPDYQPFTGISVRF